ncbi:MAG: UDPglucose 6-dehydrogenase [Chthoniobacter sp.]|jgi:UDPglucose 6-dehydrogenase/GDP-mannose 6-dehydrogenase|nr:UDPglucose 6-dehydrogenase [Chthoniobacter sp.]
MNVAVVGTGYVGLVSGVCLAARGHHVICVDLRGEIVEQLNRGEPPIHETGLPELIASAGAAGRFHATTCLEDALATAELVLVAVGTPSSEGRIDLRFIEQATAEIGRFLARTERFLAVVVKSTVVPGTTDTIVRTILEKTSGKRLGQFGLGMNPEFLREGEAVEDFLQPDRIILGHEDGETLRLLEELYRPWNCDKLAVNTRTAEMIKYASNCLLATQISAVNELANLCFEIGGIDVQDVMHGVHLDKRWSPITASGRVLPQILAYLVPGCGFGGSCFPKDVQALRTLGRDRGLSMEGLQAVLDINDRQPFEVVRQLEHALGSVKDRRILVLGLAFKPETDDVRESASLRIIRRLIELGAVVAAHDPVAIENARRELAGLPVSLTDDWTAALGDSAAVVIATRWPEYRTLSSPECAGKMRGRVLVDARRMFQPDNFPESTYLTIGRRIAQPASLAP